jgi:GH18 family chitinase
LHGSWETPTLTHHAPLFASAVNNTNSNELPASIDMLVGRLLAYGFANDQVLLGMSTYGRSLRVTVNTQVSGPGVMAGLTKMPNMISFFETCRLVASASNTVVRRDKVTRVPSVFVDDGREWIGYDDTLSFKEKVCNFKYYIVYCLAAITKNGSFRLIILGYSIQVWFTLHSLIFLLGCDCGIR